MRTLTITRRKSFVACAMKDQVYIRDMQEPELIINGVPCRKIGNIKNGESKSFPISEGEQQIFLIADKLSKNYCNATVTIPAGREDVALSGVHKFVYGSNPFRFDGVELTEAEKTQQKKNNRKGTWITIGAVLLGSAVGLFLPGGFLNPETAPAKDFAKENFQITLTEEFEEQEEEGFFSCYSTEKVIVFTVREEKVLVGNINLDEYGSLVLKANGRDGVKMNRKDDFIWFEYTDTPDEQETYYLAVCLEGEDSFWIVNFATPATNRSSYKRQFLDWAETIKAG